MSTAIRLPPELSTFLGLPGAHCLLIRGGPGSGKTALALTLLDEFSGPKLLVCGRVTRSELIREFPWAENESLTIVDTVTRAGSSDLSPAKGARKPPDRPPSAPAVVERDVSWLPPAIRETWSRADKLRGDEEAPSWVPPSLRAAWRRIDPSQPSMIVVDPWEGFVEEYVDAAAAGGDQALDRPELERRLLRQVARGSGHFVLVSERPGASALDYLANGVVELRRGSFEHHPDRWVHLAKLRGIAMEDDSYPFTLEGGRFRCVTSEGTGHRHVRIVSEPEKDPTPGMLWPGSSAFAEAFGCLAHRAMTVLESDPHVSEVSVQSLIFPVVLSVLKSGGRVFIMPPPGSRIVEIWRQLEHQLPEGVFPRQVRILLPGLNLPLDHPLAHSVVAVPSDVSPYGVAPRTRRGWEFITRYGKPETGNLVVVAAEALRALSRLTGAEYTTENLPAIAQAYLSGEAPVHQILLSRSGEPLSDSIRLMASTHLRISQRHGRTFIWGLNPVTPSYAMTMRSDERPYDLLRIV